MVKDTLMIAVSDGSFVSTITSIIGAVFGLMIGLLVYIWRSNISGFRESLDKTNETLDSVAKRLQEVDKAKADRAELLKVIEDMRQEQRENQARYVFLNETLTNALGTMRSEYAKSSECVVKHSDFQNDIRAVSEQIRELEKKIDLLLEWKAFKSGEEHGRKDR